jgi:hypothetical protein
MIGTLLFAMFAPNIASADEQVTTNDLKSNYEKTVVELEDGTNLELELGSTDSSSIIIVEYDNIISELTINEEDDTWSLTETYNDGTVKHYNHEEIAEFVKISERSRPQINKNTEIMPLAVASNIIDLGVSPSKASGKYKIEATFEAHIPGLGSIVFSTFTAILAGLAVKKLSDKMKVNNAVSSVLVLSAMVNTMFNSIKITSGSTYVVFYHYSDIDPQDPYDGFYRTQMLFFSDQNYKNRLYTVNYHWGYSIN